MSDARAGLKKLLIIGASGRTGRLVLARSLSRGHVVSVLVRDRSRLSIMHPGMRVFTGDVRVPEDIAPAMLGQDAVISMLAQPTSSSVDIFSEGTRNLADAAEIAGVRRFITVSAAPVGVEPEKLPVPMRLALLLPGSAATYYDMEVMENELMERENLDWTIVRPAVLCDTAPGQVRIEVGEFVPGGISTARIDLSEFLVQLVSSDSFVHERVAIAG